MQRFLSSAVILGLLACSPIGLIGCGDEEKIKEKETVSTPTGTTTTTNEKKVESSGSNPPPNTSGEKAK